MQNGEIKGDQLLDEQTRALTGEKSERSYVCTHISAASLCHGCLYLFLISRRKKPSLVFIHSRPKQAAACCGALFWVACYDCDSFHQRLGENILGGISSVLCIHWLRVCLARLLWVWLITNVWFCGLLGEKRNCLCECVHMHTFIQPPGEAESEECREMPFLDWSLLLTGEFCTLHVWTQHMPYTFTSKKILLHALSITHAHIFPLHHSNGFPGTYIPAHNGIIFIPQAFKGLFLQSWCAAMHQAQSKPVRN